MPRNILFIMCDQLRWDYLSCYGHLKLNTPNIDSLATFHLTRTLAGETGINITLADK